MEKEKVKKEQLGFYSQGGAGCRFAEHVAKDPSNYNWEQRVFDTVDVAAIDSYVEASISNPDIAMVSILLPSVTDDGQLEHLIAQLTNNSRIFFQEPEEEDQGFRLIRLRAKVLGKTAWVSGFGPMSFFPKTRQAPHTEIVLRVKDTPVYPPNIMRPTPPDQIHVADLEVPDISATDFTLKFRDSFRNTTRVLGHPADELSAAKTTFILKKKP